MGLLGDLKTLAHIALHPIKGKTHKERLDSFYSGQADDYDRFRQRLLQGRENMVQQVARTLPGGLEGSGGVWVELGCGTGSNLELLGDRVGRLDKAILVDLSSSLIEIATARAERLGWTNVELVEADVCAWDQLAAEADAVVFSYSLTMIPDWFAAIDTAIRALKPGGHIGVVDFTTTRKYVYDGRRKPHGWWTRSFWKTWFSNDNVFLDGNHLAYLRRRTLPTYLEERRVRLPYMPFVRCPIYTYVGQKRWELGELPPKDEVASEAT